MVRLAQLRDARVPETPRDGKSRLDYGDLQSTADLQGIGQCERLALVIEESPIFELVTTPSLALLCFRLNPRKGYSDEELDLLNQRLHTRLDVRSDVFLTQTVLKSVERKFYCLRFAMGGARTTWEDVEKTWEVVVEEGQAVLKG